MSTSHSPRPLVINWHLTEACNFHCQYCYAKWDRPGSPRDLVRSPSRRQALLEALYGYFRPDNLANLLQGQMQWDSLRLNLAGGEPLLYQRQLTDLLSQARRLGFDTSIITNGSLLSEEVISRLAPLISWLGLSVDSCYGQTNRLIGRADARGRVLPMSDLARLVAVARQANPHLRIKLNTVVNRHNQGESLAPLLESLSPDKWKVLRVLPVVTDGLAVSQAQFEAFVARHHQYRPIMTVEDNPAMTESYLMLDPLGRFFQNRPFPEQNYRYSAPVLEAGVARAFQQVHFDVARFQSRYAAQIPAGVSA